MILDYIPAVECKNKDVWFTCYQCGKCGRVFEDGIMMMMAEQPLMKKNR